AFGRQSPPGRRRLNRREPGRRFARLRSSLFRTLKHLHAAACSGDLLFCSVCETMGGDLKRFRQLTATKYRDAVLGQFTYDASLDERLGRHGLSGLEFLIQNIEVDLIPLFLKDVCESALRQAAMQGHLPALKPAHTGVTGTRLLAFVAPRGGLAVA